jgi:uncharacterized membrane protein
VQTLKTIVRFVASAAMVWIGAQHFLNPEPFVRIVPAALPQPLLLVYVSGFFEILGGLGLLIPKVRLYAGWGLIALYVAVFPANINMAINHIELQPGHPIATWLLWARLPFQALFIAVAYWLRK